MPNRPVRNIIAKQAVISVASDRSVRDAADIMAANHIGALPVIDGDRLVGIFTERDVLNRVVARGVDPTQTQVSAVMTRNPATIRPDRPVIHALHLMHEGGFRHLPVVDGSRVVGMISMRDAMGREIETFERDCEEKQAIFEVLG